MGVDDISKWLNPATWPWAIYFAILVSLIHVAWRAAGWFRQRRAAQWPTAIASIESVEVERSFLDGSNPFQAAIGYAFRVAGQVEAGRHCRRFKTEEEAEEYIRDLKGKSIAIHHHPRNPAESQLLDADLATLRKGWEPAVSVEPHLSAERLPRWLRPVIQPLVWASTAGLLVSIWVHVGAVMGRQVVGSEFFYILHIGVFAVFIPAAWISTLITKGTKRSDHWRTALHGSPEWMRYMVYAFSVYAVLNFALFFIQTRATGAGNAPPALVWRGFSGHWMVFYGSAMAVLHSAAALQLEPHR